METSIMIEGFGKSFALDLRLSSVDLQLTAIQSVIAILEHSIRVASRVEDQKLLQMQVDEVEDLRRCLFTDSIQVTLTEEDEELPLQPAESTPSLPSEHDEEVEEMVTKMNAMKGALPDLPGAMPTDDVLDEPQSCSSCSSPVDVAVVPTSADSGNCRPARARRHTWGWETLHRLARSSRSTSTPEAFT
eukprot:Skav235516  [mRNA]  locus=scaffold625:812298:823199:- [translate_table: standard]